MRTTTSLLCLLVALSASATSKRVIVQVSDIKEPKGNILIGIFDNAAHFTKVGSEIKSVSVPANAETVSIAIDDLADGEYSFTVLHDKNANGKCDFNLIGIPKEPFGFSNNVKPKLKIPSFHDTKVSVTDGMVLRIKLLSF